MWKSEGKWFASKIFHGSLTQNVTFQERVLESNNDIMVSKLILWQFAYVHAGETIEHLAIFCCGCFGLFFPLGLKLFSGCVKKRHKTSRKVNSRRLVPEMPRTKSEA